MASNLVELIFNQFLDIVEKKAEHACFSFDECDFNYRERHAQNHSLLDVLYVAEDKCGRKRQVIVTLDITKICIEDLTSCRWISYLKSLARQFINDICPKKFAVVKDKRKTCRKEPPRCELPPCRETTTIIRKIKPVVKPEKCKVVVEKCHPCIQKCVREPCPKERKVIIKYVDELPKHDCNNFTVLVKKPHQAKHFFDKHNNEHHFRPCCDDGRKDDHHDDGHHH